MSEAYWDLESRRRRTIEGPRGLELADYLRDEFPHETIAWVTRGRREDHAPRVRLPSRRRKWLRRLRGRGPSASRPAAAGRGR